MSEPKTRFGRYEVQGVLGRGAMGIVYQAEDPLIGRRVAVKVIRPEPGLDPEEAEDRRNRFEREFRAAGTLSHPSIVTVYDVGHEGSSSFIAMECITGESLQQTVQRASDLTVASACDLLFQIAAGLDFAHQRGIIHRDVKPANILISREGHAKITDFGVAKQASVTMTRTGTVLGTPAYMSPEQITGSPLTGTSDQFSLAIIGYELLTGTRPFAGESAPTVLFRIVQEPAPAPSTLNPRLPPAVDAVFAQALAKNPQARFANCVAFVRALREALGLGIGDAPLSFAGSGELANLSHDADATVATGPRDLGNGDLHLHPEPSAGPVITGSYAAVHRSSKTGLVGAIAATLALVVAGAWWFGRAPAPPPVTTVAVSTPIPGATITIDGAPSGLLTPARLELSGEPGSTQRLQVLRDGTEIARRDVTLDGSSSDWAVAEVAQQRTLTVVTNPAGAEVFVDGVTRGTSPLVVDVPPSGTVALRYRLTGYETLDEQVDLASLAEERVERTLQVLPEPSRFVVRGSFPVEVRLRGRSSTLAPGEALRTEPGRVTVELAAPRLGYRERRELVLESGREFAIDLPRTVTVQIAAQPGNCEVSVGGVRLDVTPFSHELVIGSHNFEFRWPNATRNVTVDVRTPGQRIFESLAP